MKLLKTLSKQFRPYIGPHQIEIKNAENWLKLSGTQPIFIFDFFAIGKPLRYHITTEIGKQTGINTLSADIVWIDGQDKYLKKDLLSFWFWNKNGLIPFAFVGKEAHKGPFYTYEGILFMNTIKNNDFAEMEILYMSIKENAMSKVSDSFNDLHIIYSNKEREKSEQIKQQGNALFGEGKFEDAADQFYEAMLADYTNPNPYNNLGMITQVIRKHHKRGEFFFQLSYLIDPTYTNGMRGYSSYPASQGNFKKSIKLMKKCSKIEPSAQNFGILARFYFDSGDIKRAQSMCQKAILLDPEHPSVLEIQTKLNSI